MSKSKEEGSYAWLDQCPEPQGESGRAGKTGGVVPVEHIDSPADLSRRTSQFICRL